MKFKIFSIILAVTILTLSSCSSTENKEGDTKTTTKTSDTKDTATNRDSKESETKSTDATDTKSTDTKSTDTKSTDTKSTDTKTTDTKTTDTKTTDTKTTDTKTTDTKTTDTKTTDTKIDFVSKLSEINETLKQLRYPDGKSTMGFAYKSSALPNPKDFQNWYGKHGSAVKEAFAILPKSYVLEITGHTDAKGPEDAQPDLNKKGNKFYSAQRAEAVKKALVKSGVQSDRIIAKGVGTEQLIPDVDPLSAIQRRVTFQFIQKDEMNSNEKENIPSNKKPTNSSTTNKTDSEKEPTP